MMHILFCPVTSSTTFMGPMVFGKLAAAPLSVGMATFMVIPFHIISAAPPIEPPLGWQLLQPCPVVFSPSLVSLKSFSPLLTDASRVSGCMVIIISCIIFTFSSSGLMKSSLSFVHRLHTFMLHHFSLGLLPQAFSLCKPLFYAFPHPLPLSVNILSLNKVLFMLNSPYIKCQAHGRATLRRDVFYLTEGDGC